MVLPWVLSVSRGIERLNDNDEYLSCSQIRVSVLISHIDPKRLMRNPVLARLRTDDRRGRPCIELE